MATVKHYDGIYLHGEVYSEECSKCEGFGYIKERFTVGYLGENEVEEDWVECPECKGTGCTQTLYLECYHCGHIVHEKDMRVSHDVRGIPSRRVCLDCLDEFEKSLGDMLYDYGFAGEHIEEDY